MNLYHLNRIIGGVWIYKYLGDIYEYSLPSRKYRFYAETIYQDTYDKSVFLGSHTEKTVLKELIRRGVWSKSKERVMKETKESIDKFKIEMYKKELFVEQRKNIKISLERAKEELTQLYRERTSMNVLTAEYAASIAKQRFLIGAGLLINGEPLWPNPIKEHNCESVVEYISNCVARDTLSDTQLRQLAKSEEWKSYSGFKDILPAHPLDMNEEQRTLCLWHQMYQNIYKHPECPSEVVIEDDDMLDGWMLVQRTEKDKTEQKADYQENMIFVKTQEEANDIYSKNSFGAQVRLAKRWSALDKAGVLNEAHMPDSREQIEMEINARAKG